MKLSKCKLGEIVIMKDSGTMCRDAKVGMIVGLTYNCRVQDTGMMSAEERIERTIPEVKFPDGSSHGVHPGNLELYNK